jgi:hypothetical protein
MTYKLLIDECLSPTLVGLAVAAGHVESRCVRDLGWSGTKDWKLVRLVIEHDYTLVTHNSVDFRGGGPDRLGGHHAQQPIHAGLVCLNSVRVMDLARQRDLFGIALAELAVLTDLVNQALEIFEQEDGAVVVERYEIPQDGV